MTQPRSAIVPQIRPCFNKHLMKISSAHNIMEMHGYICNFLLEKIRSRQISEKKDVFWQKDEINR